MIIETQNLRHSVNNRCIHDHRVILFQVIFDASHVVKRHLDKVGAHGRTCKKLVTCELLTCATFSELVNLTSLKETSSASICGAAVENWESWAVIKTSEKTSYVLQKSANSKPYRLKKTLCRTVSFIHLIWCFE